MRLTELEPHFLRIVEPNRFAMIESLAEADGIEFLCPKCFVANSGPVGTHHVICWQPHIAQDIHPNPGRWTFEGTGYDDLTLVAGSSSVLLVGGCASHFFVRNGEIISVG